MNNGGSVLRGLSNLLATLMIIGIVIASSILVSNLVLTQLSKSSKTPSHVQVIDVFVEKNSPSMIKVKITFYNPSDMNLELSIYSLEIYTEGFSEVIQIEYIDEDEFASIELLPGESEKVEIIGSISSEVTVGVLVVYFTVRQAGTNTIYIDCAVTPVSLLA